MRRTGTIQAAAVLTTVLLAAGCSSGGTNDDPATSEQGQETETQSPEPSDTQEPEDETATGDEGGEDCFIHLFDGDDFDDTDDNFKLTEPGRYENLADLPGADKDWTDEADSLKVGAGATVTIYAEENFEGASQDLDPGTEIADVDDEPQSLEMSCD